MVRMLGSMLLRVRGIFITPSCVWKAATVKGEKVCQGAQRLGSIAIPHSRSSPTTSSLPELQAKKGGVWPLRLGNLGWISSQLKSNLTVPPLDSSGQDVRARWSGGSYRSPLPENYSTVVPYAYGRNMRFSQLNRGKRGRRGAVFT